MPRLSRAGERFTELTLEIFRLNGLLLAAGDALSRPSGLSSARWQILGVVEHGPATVAQIARAMGLTRQSVQQTADALADDGMLEYRDNPQHRRAKLLAMTDAGEQALRQVQQAHVRWANALGRGCDEAGVAAAVDVLRQVRAQLEAT